MISDEMRELLSTYIDGELTRNDATRVEDMSKRDPELRREIEAYRILRRQLKQWDATDNDVTPPPSLGKRALERARAYVSVTGLGTARRFGGVFALAAGLLLAIGLGVILAGAGETGSVSIRAIRPVLPDSARAPFEEVPGSTSVVSLWESEQAIPEYEDLYTPFREALVRADKALRDREAQRALVKRLKRDDSGTRTGTYAPEIVAMMSGIEAVDAPLAALVIFRNVVDMDAPNVVAMPVGADVGKDDEADRLMIDTRKLATDRSRLLLAGELFVGSKDRSNRVRVVSASHWVRESSNVPMVWADRIKVPRNSRRLVLQSEMLGPKARRAIARKQALPKGALKSLMSGGKARQESVAKLMASLRGDGGATGFAVIAGKIVLGVELFATHELMLAFAPRLLHGYLAEAGTAAIRLTAPTGGDDSVQKLARKLVDKISRHALKLTDVTGGTDDEWPEGLRRVNVMAGRTAIAGHGLLLNNRPLHITLFGE